MRSILQKFLLEFIINNEFWVRQIHGTEAFKLKQKCTFCFCSHSFPLQA